MLYFKRVLFQLIFSDLKVDTYNRIIVYIRKNISMKNYIWLLVFGLVVGGCSKSSDTGCVSCGVEVVAVLLVWIGRGFA